MKSCPGNREKSIGLFNSLIEELEAINGYQQRVDASEDDELREILAHNRDEEKEHAAMILEWIRPTDQALSGEMKTYLFTSEEITEIEEKGTAEERLDGGRKKRN